jgi:hypothetical protein
MLTTLTRFKPASPAASKHSWAYFREIARYAFRDLRRLSRQPPSQKQMEKPKLLLGLLRVTLLFNKSRLMGTRLWFWELCNHPR